MKHEELVNMNMKDLKARLKEIGTQAQTAEGEVLDAMTTEAEDINGILQDIQNVLACPFLDFWMPKLTALGNGGMIWALAGGVLFCTKNTGSRERFCWPGCWSAHW